MLTIETLAPRALFVDLNGIVTQDDIARLRESVEPLVQSDGDISLLVDMVGVSDVTGKAIAADLKLETQMIRYWTRFTRVAVVTDKKWVANLTRVSAHLVPRSDFRVFEPADLDKAKTFITGKMEDGSKRSTGLRRLGSQHPDLLAYEVDGVVGREDAEAMVKTLESALSSKRPVSVLVKMTHYGGFEPSLLFSGNLWAVKLAAVKGLHRYAIVGDSGWLNSISGFANPLTAVEMKAFSKSDEAEAWDWAVDGLTPSDHSANTGSDSA
ncbi:STAS/SEC14 domain-containing protein [Qingshengfaniella alkalisoli]|nr:STAS/SEC14 domain-containing protein [Qingshengfaniella alkalisoli]